MLRWFALAAVALIATPAIAQHTNCMVTGYGTQQHVWCNSTPPPDNSSGQYLQQSEGRFGGALGRTIATWRARSAQEQAEREQAADNLRQINAFEAEPGHPRFAELRPYMAQLLSAGRVNTLQDAYDLASAQHPAQ